MNKNFVVYVLIVLTLPCKVFGQETMPKDYLNTAVKEGQLKTTKKFLRSLEEKQLKQATDLLDISYLSRNPKIQNELTRISILIHKIKEHTKVSEGLIVYEENHNVYRCIYYDNKVEYQLIDIHYEEGNPNSKILKLAFKNEEVLKKERDEREINNTEPPPPPLVATGVTQASLTNDTNLKKHKVFKTIEISIPEMAKRLETNREMDEDMGFVKFASGDEKIEITFRKMEKMNLFEVKSMMDGMSESLYKGKILRSEIIEINKIKIFVTDIKGQWNGKGDLIGMFRYYFNVAGDCYNLLMRYPADSIENTMELKDKMISSIEIE